MCLADPQLKTPALVFYFPSTQPSLGPIGHPAATFFLPLGYLLNCLSNLLWRPVWTPVHAIHRVLLVLCYVLLQYHHLTSMKDPKSQFAQHCCILGCRVKRRQ